MMPLAAGGMARIYIGRSTGIGSFERHVVLKMITPERANDQVAVNMFLDEARLAALREVMADVSFDAVWFARGGYGSNRIADAALADLPPAARGTFTLRCRPAITGQVRTSEVTLIVVTPALGNAAQEVLRP